MKTRNIVTAIAAVFLAVGFVNASSAQDNNVTQDGIEVITITAKRPDLSAAAVCVNEVIAQASSGNLQGDNAVEDRRALRNAIRQCIAQATASATTRI